VFLVFLSSSVLVKAWVSSVLWHHLQPDHLGSPRKVIQSSTNTAIWDWPILNNPFGETAPNQDPDGNAVPFVLNLRFPGQYFDVETGLHYNYFRDYEPGTGRYVESDPIGLDGGVATYAYADDSPLSKIDYLGLKTCGAGWNDKIVPDNPFGFKFSECCQGHDDCYGCEGERYDMQKIDCDSNFRVCMREKCKKYAPPIRFACKRIAGMYYGAVRRFSGKPFKNARKKCDGCNE
jgi:RHS repeat-associated protein